MKYLGYLGRLNPLSGTLRSYFILAVGVLAAFAVAMGGCEKKPKVTAVVVATGPGMPGEEAMPLPSLQTSVPMPIWHLQARSAQIYHLAKVRRWDILPVPLNMVRVYVRDLPGERDTVTLRVPHLRRTVDNLDRAIRVRDRLGAMMYANEINRLAIEMSVPYRPTVPVELSMLNNDARELEIWTCLNDLPRLRLTVTRMSEQWDNFKVYAREHGALRPSANLEAKMIRLRHARTVADYSALIEPVRKDLYQIRVVLLLPVDEEEL